MGCTEATAKTRVYRPSNPHSSPLYQCVRKHYEEVVGSGVVHRRVEEQALSRFIDCGDLHKGFARIYCDDCGHDYLLAFSCKRRYFCPSCHQKRMLAYGDWVEEEVLYPVPHRQYVFTLPKLLRPHFHQRHRLGRWCRIVSGLLNEVYKEVAPWGKPGYILFVQTFGDLVTFHPHIHALVADGIFVESGTFRVLPPIPTVLLAEPLRHAVLDYLVEDEAITEEFAHRLLSWKHSGFSVDNTVGVGANDPQGRRQLARYMIRNPFSLKKMEYQAQQGMVVYRSRHHATLKRNFQIMPGAAWLKLLLQHVPDRGEHLVRYYGWYSNRSRGDRKRSCRTTDEIETDAAGGPDSDTPESELTKAARSTWARLIKKVYEVDPLICPHCGGQMRFLAVIEEPPVIERILDQIGEWCPSPPPRAPPAEQEWPKGCQIPLSYHPVPDIA